VTNFVHEVTEYYLIFVVFTISVQDFTKLVFS